MLVSCVRCHFYMYLSMSHTLQTPLRKVTIEMSVSGLTLPDNINRIARLSINPFLICKKEQNEIILNFKIFENNGIYS